LVFFLCFFGISAIGQFYFVRSQADQLNAKKISESIKNINQAISYNDGIDLKNYSKAYIVAADYYIVFNDGSIFDFWPDQKIGVPPGLLPPVECPVLENRIFAKPSVATYLGPAKKPEQWTFYAKHFDNGYVIAGISEYDNVNKVDYLLKTNIAYFGDTFESALQVTESKIDNGVSWALINNKNELVNGSGMIPLKTNAIELGKNSSKPHHRRLGANDYYISYGPIIDKKGTHVGFAILPLETNSTESMIRTMRNFNFIIAIVSIFTFGVVASVYNSRHEREKRVIRESLQNYFSPQIMEAILKDPQKLKLGGQRREITVLFSDIRSFTSLSEKLTPTDLSIFLQEYFNEMTEAVFNTDGILDKYIGDGLMAFWGAPIEQPDQADRAVNTAVDMMKRLKVLKQKWNTKEYSGIDIGIGINLGIAAIGNFGSIKRYDYTVIGDTVNTASRLESLNKEFQSNILIADSVRSQLSFKIDLIDKGDLEIKGKGKIVHVFQVRMDSGNIN
jgi:class 3 adenylate cyclase